MVYYKRKGKERWLGPATEVFKDGKVVFVNMVEFLSLNMIHDKVYRTESRENTDECEEHSDSINETTMEKIPFTELIPNPEDPEVNENRGANIAIGIVNLDQDRGGPQSVKVNDIIRYKVEDKWVTDTILGRAGKTTGKYKTWYNHHLKMGK